MYNRNGKKHRSKISQGQTCVSVEKSRTGPACHENSFVLHSLFCRRLFITIHLIIQRFFDSLQVLGKVNIVELQQKMAALESCDTEKYSCGTAAE